MFGHRRTYSAHSYAIMYFRTWPDEAPRCENLVRLVKRLTICLIVSQNCKYFNSNVLRCDFNSCVGSNYALLDKTADSSCSNSFLTEHHHFFASPAPQKKGHRSFHKKIFFPKKFQDGNKILKNDRDHDRWSSDRTAHVNILFARVWCSDLGPREFLSVHSWSDYYTRKWLFPWWLCGAIQISFFRPIVKFIVVGIWPIGCLEIS